MPFSCVCSSVLPAVSALVCQLDWVQGAGPGSRGGGGPCPGCPGCLDEVGKLPVST